MQYKKFKQDCDLTEEELAEKVGVRKEAIMRLEKCIILHLNLQYRYQK